MKGILKVRWLLIFAVTLMVLYHGVNLCSWLGLTGLTPTSYHSYRLPGLTFKLALYAGDPGDSFDATTTILRRFGYLLRYWVGHRDWMILEGKETRTSNIFNRREIEFLYADEKPKFEKEIGPKIQRFVQTISRKGVDVVIVPLPPKVALEREKLSAILPPHRLWAASHVVGRSGTVPEDPYGNFRVVVDAAPDHVVDLFKIYRQFYERFPDRNLYVPWDLHWSSLGIALAAKAVLEHLESRGFEAARPKLRYVRTAPLTYNFRLPQRLQVPSYYLRTKPGFIWYEELFRLDTRSHPKQQGRLILTGDSNGERWYRTEFGFGPLLAKALQRELLDLSTPGTVGVLALEALNTRAIRLKEGDLLVWLFQLPLEFEHLGEKEFPLLTVQRTPMEITSESTEHSEGNDALHPH